jgi:hypothetical protein
MTKVADIFLLLISFLLKNFKLDFAKHVCSFKFNIHEEISVTCIYSIFNPINLNFLISRNFLINLFNLLESPNTFAAKQIRYFKAHKIVLTLPFEN